MDPWPQCTLSKSQNLFSKSLLLIFSTVSNPPPLFSAAVSAIVITFLYIPYPILSIFFSPVFLFTLFLLFTLLHFGSPTVESDSNFVLETESFLLSSSPKQFFCETWLEFGRPLEIIYEECEEEEEKSDESWPEYSNFDLRGIEGFSYLDSLKESMCLLWDEEADGLIEIGLEEDNMFEIDLSA